MDGLHGKGGVWVAHVPLYKRFQNWRGFINHGTVLHCGLKAGFLPLTVLCVEIPITCLERDPDDSSRSLDQCQCC